MDTIELEFDSITYEPELDSIPLDLESDEPESIYDIFDDEFSHEEFDTPILNSPKMLAVRKWFPVVMLVLILLVIILTAIVFFKSPTGSKDAPLSSQQNTLFTPSPFSDSLQTGIEMLQKGDFDGAFAAFEELKNAEGTTDDIYLFGADICLKQGDYNQAINILQEGFDLLNSRRLLKRIEYIRQNVVLSQISAENRALYLTKDYSPLGDLISEDVYDQNYTRTGRNEIKYNNEGRISRTCSYDAAGVLTVEVKYIYNNEGILVDKIDFNNNGLQIASHRYVYDNAGNLIESIDYDSAGSVIWTTKSEYNSSGQKLKDSGYDGTGQLTGWVDTSYNENGDLHQSIRHSQNGDIIEFSTLDYDSDGKLIRSTLYDGQQTVQNRTEILYTEDGSRAKDTIYTASGTISGWVEYDNSGHKIRERNETLQNTYSFVYQYVGDILCENTLTEVSGKLTLTRPTGYRRIANSSAAYVQTAKAGTVFTVIGETDAFYLVEEGWYFSKDPAGITINITE